MRNHPEQFLFAAVVHRYKGTSRYVVSDDLDCLPPDAAEVWRPMPKTFEQLTQWADYAPDHGFYATVNTRDGLYETEPQPA